MIKVQTGQIVEFYSNSCSVVSGGKEFKCKIRGRINLVVGDLVEIETASSNDSVEGIVTRRLDRASALYKSKDKVKIKKPSKGKVVSSPEYEKIAADKAEEMRSRWDGRRSRGSGRAVQIRN